jgi:hypothetical protein
MIKNLDTANFTTVIIPWLMKGFGKIIFLTVKGIHMAYKISLFSFSSFKELALFWLLNKSESDNKK